MMKRSWCVERRPKGKGVERVIVKRPGNIHAVAKIIGDPRSAAENEANAILLAAAPALLHACTEAWGLLNSLKVDDAIEVLRVGLAEAKGGPTDLCFMCDGTYEKHEPESDGQYPTHDPQHCQFSRPRSDPTRHR